MATAACAVAVAWAIQRILLVRWVEISPGTIDQSVLWSLGSALTVAFVALRFLDQSVSREVQKLGELVDEVGEAGHHSRSVALEVPGEIQDLSLKVEEMLCKLAKARGQLVEGARVAGMSEVSMGLIHGLGNVLNGINLSAEQVATNMKQLGVRDLELLIRELEDHQEELAHYLTKDSSGRFLLPFLSAMTNSITNTRDKTLGELRSMEAGIQQVINIVRSQERYVVGVNLIEPTDIAQQLDIALNICHMSRGQPDDVTVEREYEDLPKAHLDRHKLMGILINLIQNAYDAIEESGRFANKLCVRLRSVDRTLFAIEIEDTGVGIPEGALTKIFTTGFTTKPGAQGMGLHVAANAASEMSGFLRAVSDGIDEGSTFILHIPRDVPQMKDSEPAEGFAIPQRRESA